MTTLAMRWTQRNPTAFLVVAALLWWGLYQSLIPASEALVAALPVARDSHLGGALQFSSTTRPRSCCC